MRFIRGLVPMALLGAILANTGCETTEPKKTVSAPPTQAKAPVLTTPAVQTLQPPPKIQERAAPKPDPATVVIAQAEKQYDSGQANYRGGHLEAAKKDFDSAFDTILGSNLDVRTDERLQQEFDKIVEAVHELELLALKQGDGFSEQQSEPAPIDEANDVTFPVDPNIRAKAEAEIKTTKSDLPLMLNDEVAMFINYFSSPKGRATLERALARSGRYRDMISRILKEEGVPQDLIYLAQAESGFQPLALSRAGARGMWQFMAGRASMYGLERNWWVDDRQDPEKATRAAARHLKDLYNQFGDWYLAMAAYNSGPGTIQHAVERTGYADFWELYRRGVLPQETRNYVPIILAVTIMAKNPAQYGLENIVPDPSPEADVVSIDYPVDLRLVAECVDTSVNYLQELNPSLLRMTTPKDDIFTLRLPVGSREKFQTAISAIPLDMRTSWRYHRVEYGETLATIARKYHTTTSSIADANSLSGDDVQVWAKLIIPIVPHRDAPESVAYAQRATRYKVRKGDTLYSIADDFEVPVEKLRKWNHLRGTTVAIGRSLVIYKPVSDMTGTDSAAEDDPAPSMPRSSAHTTAATASRGSIRTVSAARTGASAHRSKPEPRTKEAASVRHKVKRGETLSSIAESYNTTVAALKRAAAEIGRFIRK